MFGDIVAVHVDIVTIGVKGVVKNERRVHERTGIDKTSPFLDFHFLNVEDKTSVEYLERDRALSSKQNDFVVRDLVSKPHVGWHPLRLVDLRVVNFLPNIPRNVVDLNRVNYSLLVNPTSKGKYVVVLERAQRDTSSRYPHFVDGLPFVLLSVVCLTPSIYLVVHECAYHIDKTLD